MDEIGHLVDDLVGSAQRNGGFDFTQTLLRVGGLESADAFEAFRSDYSASNWKSDPRETYCRWSKSDDFLRFIWNLIQCSESLRYSSHTLVDGSAAIPLGQHRWIHPQKVEQLVTRAKQAKRDELATWITAAYPPGLLAGCMSEGKDTEVYGDPLAKVAALNAALLEAADRQRRAFGTSNRFFRWPQFEVLEILANEQAGLFGYRVHFSNGSYAEYSRDLEGTEALNISFERDGTVNYFIGSLDDLRQEWRIREKRLFEVGLPGRYNEIGKWKPIVYEGPTADYSKEIAQLSDDPEVQGALFYIYTTAHWAVEFAARATVDLPVEKGVSFGPTDHPLRLWKLPNAEHSFGNERLYDGWVTLPAPTVEAVQQALSHIRIGMSRLAFVYDAELRWCTKYSVVKEFGGLAKPNEDDLARFDEVLTTAVPPALDLAMSWTNAGHNAADPLTSFLCYFNAIEAIVEAAWEDDLELPSGPLIKASKVERLETRRACMEDAHRRYFPHDPNNFAKEVYFNCFGQLARRRRQVAEYIWGESHAAVLDLFERRGDDPSLSEIRDRIAHGRLSLLDTEDVTMVKRHLTRLSEIAKAMILRVLLRVRPGYSVPVWSGQHTMAMSMADPRSTMVTNTLKMFPDTDWSIRAEWIDTT